MHRLESGHHSNFICAGWKHWFRFLDKLWSKTTTTRLSFSHKFQIGIRSSRWLQCERRNSPGFIPSVLSVTLEKSVLEALRNTKGGTSVTLATGEDLSLRDKPPFHAQSRLFPFYRTGSKDRPTHARGEGVECWPTGPTRIGWLLAHFLFLDAVNFCTKGQWLQAQSLRCAMFLLAMKYLKFFVK
jgi:hypothetical protein